MSTTLPTPGGTDRFLTIAEVAELSGLSEKTIRDHVSRGWLKALQMGGPRGRIRVSMSAVYEWLGQSPAKSTEPPLESVDWSVPADYADPDDLTICDEQTLWLPVAQSRLGEFFDAKIRSGR